MRAVQLARRPALVSALVVASVTSVVAAPSSARAQAAPPPLTREQALRVLRAFEEKNAQNNDGLDVEGQATIETAPIQTIDDANFREFRGRGMTSLGEDARIDQRRVYVPEQAGYPLQFLASERNTSSDGATTRQLLLFVRPNEGDPWKVSMAAGLVGSVPKLLVDRDGFARLLDADHAASLVLEPDGLARSLAALWDRGEGVSDPKPFEPGPFTTDAVTGFVSTLGAMGINAVADFTFTPADTPVVSFRTAKNGALSFFVVAVTEVMRPDGVGALVQPESREVFSGLLVPGQYGEVRFERLAILAAHVPPAGRKARIDVIGIYEGLVQATATGAGATV